MLVQHFELMWEVKKAEVTALTNSVLCYLEGSDGQEIEEKQEGGESVVTGRHYQIRSHSRRRLKSEHTAAGTQFIITGT